MEGEADLPAPRPATSESYVRPIHSESYLNRSITSSSSSSSSSPGFLRHVQAAFKRRRPLGTMQSNSMKPRRTILPQRGTFISSAENLGVTGDSKKVEANDVSKHSYPAKDLIALRNITTSDVGETQDDASITPPSTLATLTDTYNERFQPGDVQRDKPEPSTGLVNSEEGAAIESQKKVQFSLGNDVGSQGNETIED